MGLCLYILLLFLADNKHVKRHLNLLLSYNAKYSRNKFYQRYEEHFIKIRTFLRIYNFILTCCFSLKMKKFYFIYVFTFILTISASGKFTVSTFFYPQDRFILVPRTANLFVQTKMLRTTPKISYIVILKGVYESVSK